MVDPAKNADSFRKSEIIKIFRAENRQQNTSLLLKTLIKKNRLPAIALVQPKQNDTRNDILETLGEHSDKYTFKDFKVNIRSEHEIIKTLKEVDSERKFNLIALFRGGGETNDFDVFDTVTMAEAIIGIHTPFVMAVGHAGDEPFAQRVCDRAFSTPGDLGSYLREMYVNSGREDDLTFVEDNFKKSQNKLNLEWINVNQEKEELFENVENLKREAALLAKTRGEFRIIEEENAKLRREIDVKNNSRWQTTAALGLAGLLLIAATYFVTLLFLNSSQTTGVSTDKNSNSNTISNFSNAKNK